MPLVGDVLVVVVASAVEDKAKVRAGGSEELGLIYRSFSAELRSPPRAA